MKIMIITTNYNTIFIEFEKFDWESLFGWKAIDQIKQLPGKRYNPTTKKWSVPNTKENNEIVNSLKPTSPFTEQEEYEGLVALTLFLNQFD
jgi:alpha-N-acetylglucosamine transferase